MFTTFLILSKQEYTVVKAYRYLLIYTYYVSAVVLSGESDMLYV